jgi:phenylalanyl-tRNA synthetase beta chain
MKIPLSWLKEFVALPTKISHDDIAAAFVKVGFEVEEISLQGSDLTGPIKVGKVLSIEELSEHKKPIRYVGLDTGEGKTRFVICGARNFKVNDLVVVAIPGSVLPGDFAISARETYGKTSNGMICSGKELGISDDSAGIIVLPSGKIGENAIELLEIKDVIFDIAVNPDRGYAMSVRGLARELAGALKLKFIDPASLIKSRKYDSIKSSRAVTVKIEDKDGADLIYIRTLDQVDVKRPTPIWMQRRIEKCGMRSISLAVDITNYVMLELGQPLHAFDADVLHGGLRVASAAKFKKLVTLDKVDRKLSAVELLICDDSGPQALAGTMGGLNSEVTINTKKIALEAAHFNPQRIARNSRIHGLSSEASRRIERGTDPALTALASVRASELLIELAGAKFVGSAFAGTPVKNKVIKVNPKKINDLIGYSYSAKQIKDALIAIGCKLTGTASNISVTIPSWRPDLNTIADISEEIARLNDYELIPSKLPIGKKGAQLTRMQQRKRAVANMLASQGLTEVINYPFTNQEMVDLLGFSGDRAKSLKIANPMSEEFPLLRTHLIPGLLTTLQRNLSRGAKDVAIFELGAVFRNTTVLADAVMPDLKKKPTAKMIDQIYSGVPKQMLFVGGVLVGEQIKSGWQGKGLPWSWQDGVAKALEIVESTGNTYEIINTELAPWHPGRCAEIKVNGKAVAHAGELHPRVCAALNLPARTVVFAVILSELPMPEHSYLPRIWNFPAVVQDVALVVDGAIAAISVKNALIEGGGDLLESVELFDRYDQIGDGKISLAFTLTFRSSDQTLTSEEVAKYRDQAVALASKKYGAVLRG